MLQSDALAKKTIWFFCSNCNENHKFSFFYDYLLLSQLSSLSFEKLPENFSSLALIALSPHIVLFRMNRNLIKFTLIPRPHSIFQYWNVIPPPIADGFPKQHVEREKKCGKKVTISWMRATHSFPHREKKKKLNFSSVVALEISTPKTAFTPFSDFFSPQHCCSFFHSPPQTSWNNFVVLSA